MSGFCRAFAGVRPRPWLVVAAATIGCAGVRLPPEAPREGAGRVVVSRGEPILIDEGGALAFVRLVPGATILGVTSAREMRPGDPVRYRWQRVEAGVRLADRIEVAPTPWSDPAHLYSESELLLARARGEPPLLIDIRPPEAFREGRLPGARARAEGWTGAVQARTPVVLYGDGPRDDAPFAAARQLLAAGVSDVRVLQGGLQSWVDADRWVELAAEDLGRSPGETWAVVDVRPKEAAMEARASGSVSMPLEAFRWQEFDGPKPIPPILLVGDGPGDPAPAAFAERIRTLRSAAKTKQPMRLAILVGGFAAWKRAGLPVEAGGEPATALPFIPSVSYEIAPQEFHELWTAKGGGTTFLDVRSDAVPGGEWLVAVPLEDLPSRLATLPRQKQYVVFCARGERSRVAAEFLRANGFEARFLRAPAPH